MSALLFGSISTVAETSELQRHAFNEAFRAHGLDWQWDRDDYLTMLRESGGEARIAAYAAAREQSVDAKALHATKSSLFQQSLAGSGVKPRPGVAETITAARRSGMKLGLVTTTSTENITALLDALSPAIKRTDFDVIVDASDVEQPKPAPDAYSFRLQSLSEKPADCIAVEDNVDGARAATAAGLTCIAFPNQNTSGHDFPVTRRVDHLDLAELTALAASA